MSIKKAFITRNDLAEYLSIKPATLQRMERNGEGPLPYFLTKAKRARALYRWSDVEEWLETCIPEHMRKNQGGK